MPHSIFSVQTQRLCMLIFCVIHFNFNWILNHKLILWVLKVLKKPNNINLISEEILLCSVRFKLARKKSLNNINITFFQCGLPEAIVHSISQCQPDARPWLYRNIVLTGGNANFKNFRERIETEVRQLAPDMYDVSFWKIFLSNLVAYYLIKQKEAALLNHSVLGFKY